MTSTYSSRMLRCFFLIITRSDCQKMIISKQEKLHDTRGNQVTWSSKVTWLFAPMTCTHFKPTGMTVSTYASHIFLYYMYTTHQNILSLTMAVSLEQYRRAIGSFNGAKYILLPAINLLSRGAKMSAFTLVCVVKILLLILSNDIELNPGPLNTRNLNVGYCNIRGIRANLSNLKVHLSTYYDIFCSTETMLSQSVGMGN